MIIGIDIHGVIDTYPEKIKELIIDRILQNDTIYIITGPPAIQAEEELEKLHIIRDIHYKKIISVVDWLKTRLDKDEMWQDEKGEWWCNDAEWWCSKARICTEYKVDAMIDDSEKYLIGWDITDCKTEFYLVKDKTIERKR